MKSNPAISIIIPVYNTPTYYLRNCITSILNQSFNNFEVIIVNDGSSEKDTLEFLSAISDSRFKVFNIKNRGASGARNYGLKKIAGKYTMFIDSDDFIDINYLERLHELLRTKNEKIIFTGRICQTSKKCDMSNLEKRVGYDFLSSFLPLNSFAFISQGVIFESKLTNNVSFNENIKTTGEDTSFILDVLKNNNYECYIDGGGGYNYIQRGNSLSHSAKVKKTKQYLRETRLLFDKISSNLNCNGSDLSLALQLKMFGLIAAHIDNGNATLRNTYALRKTCRGILRTDYKFLTSLRKITLKEALQVFMLNFSFPFYVLFKSLKSRLSK